MAVVESVKTAADVYCPIGGEIIEVNEALRTTPELVNQDPYSQGWMFRVNVSDVDELTSLLDAEGYNAQVAEE